MSKLKKFYLKNRYKLPEKIDSYFHAYDDNEIISIIFFKILEYADEERSYGNLWIATMKEIGCYFEARETASICLYLDRKTIYIKLNTKLDTTKYNNVGENKKNI